MAFKQIVSKSLGTAALWLRGDGGSWLITNEITSAGGPEKGVSPHSSS